ncbi:hypothetical protein CTM44_01580 [Prevotella intermedia]|nr:hypothetical protein CTM44_01580 [Prevotella intermedia]
MRTRLSVTILAVYIANIVTEIYSVKDKEKLRLSKCLYDYFACGVLLPWDVYRAAGLLVYREQWKSFSSMDAMRAVICRVGWSAQDGRQDAVQVKKPRD